MSIKSVWKRMLLIILVLSSQSAISNLVKNKTISDLGTLPKVVTKDLPFHNSVVALAFYLKDSSFGRAAGNYYPFCTGSVYKSDQILTAAHCVTSIGDFFNNSEKEFVNSLTLSDLQELGVELRVIFSKNLQRFYPSKTEAVISASDVPYSIKVTKWTTKPGKGDSEDLGLLLVENTIPDEYPPLKLIEKEIHVLNGKLLHIGYNFSGTKGILRYVETALIDPDVIRKINPGEEIQIPGFEELNREIQDEGEIAYFLIKGNAPNKGSSGGPILALIKNEWVVVGVTSEGWSEFEGEVGDKSYLDFLISPESKEFIHTETAPAIMKSLDWIEKASSLLMN